MSEDDFWISTPAYFEAKQEAHFERFKNEWEQTRFIAFVVAKTVDSKKRIRKPSDLLPFDWDEQAKKKAKKLTAEEIENMREFDKEADLIMQKYHPEAWAKILKEREKAQKLQNGG